MFSFSSQASLSSRQTTLRQLCRPREVSVGHGHAQDCNVYHGEYYYIQTLRKQIKTSQLCPPIDVCQFVPGHVIVVVASCVCSFPDLLVHPMTLMSSLGPESRHTFWLDGITIFSMERASLPLRWARVPSKRFDHVQYRRDNYGCEIRTSCDVGDARIRLA